MFVHLISKYSFVPFCSGCCCLFFSGCMLCVCDNNFDGRADRRLVVTTSKVTMRQCWCIDKRNTQKDIHLYGKYNISANIVHLCVCVFFESMNRNANNFPKHFAINFKPFNINPLKSWFYNSVIPSLMDVIKIRHHHQQQSSSLTPTLRPAAAAAAVVAVNKFKLDKIKNIIITYQSEANRTKIRIETRCVHLTFIIPHNQW